MKLSVKFRFVALFAVFAVGLFALGMYVEKASAHEGEVSQAQAQPQQTPPQPFEVVYDYTAQPGDSYTLMARKAIQTYGITSKTNLNQAQIIYAETLLTQEAESPLLDLGQKVTIKESTVKSWTDKAGQLSDAQKAAWGAYAEGVDFNTNHVGQSN